MPRNKKPFIDKKKAITFSLNTEFEKALLTQQMKQNAKGAEMDQNTQKSGQMETPTNQTSFEGPAKNHLPIQLNQFDDAEDEENFVIQNLLGFRSSYNYKQHMREIGVTGGVFISPDGEMFDAEEIAMNAPAFVPTPQDEEIDSELKEALENYDEKNFEELPDNFLELANQELESGIDVGNYGSLDDIEEDEPKLPPKNQQNQKHITKPSHDDMEEISEPEDTHENRKRTEKDDIFDMAVRKFEQDLDELFGDDESDPENQPPNSSLFQRPSQQGLDPSQFNDVFDEFLERRNALKNSKTHEEVVGKKLVTKIEVPESVDMNEVISEMHIPDEVGLRISYKRPNNEDIKKFLEVSKALEENEEDEEDDEELDEAYFKEKEIPQWDCESIISTYSNLDNHPALIVEPTKKIKLNKKGFPKIEKETVEEDSEEEKTNLGVPRLKNETPEQKKLRKKAVKEERQANRVQKKELKTAYREETTKQRNRVAGKLENRTIFHL